MMKEHIAYINQFCKLCKSSVSKASARHYNIKTYVSEINFMYRSEIIDISQDDRNCQIGVICHSCYRVILKCHEEIKYKKKNPSSSFSYRTRGLHMVKIPWCTRLLVLKGPVVNKDKGLVPVVNKDKRLVPVVNKTNTSKNRDNSQPALHQRYYTKVGRRYSRKSQ